MPRPTIRPQPRTRTRTRPRPRPCPIRKAQELEPELKLKLKLKPLTRSQIDEKLEAAVRRRTADAPWYPNYEAWVQKRMRQEELEAPVLSNLARYVGSLEAKTLLEIGSGMGGMLVSLRKNGLRVAGVEFNQENCEITRLRALRYDLDAPVVRGAGEHLPVKSDSVDVALLYEVLEHVREPLSVLQELRRALRPSGAAFITVPNRFSLYDHHYHLWGVNLLPRTLGDAVVNALGRRKTDHSAGVQALSEMHYFSWSGVKKLLRTAGFDWLDIAEDKLLSGVDLDMVGAAGRPIAWLRRARLLEPVYRAARASFISHFHLLLRPRSSEAFREKAEAPE